MLQRRPGRHFYEGIVAAFPIALGYLPAAFAFGVLADQVGLSYLAAVLMSILVFAGASQYAALALIAAGQSVATIIATTFIVNLRHLLMATVLAPHLRTWPTLKRILFSLQMTDETFALHSTQFPNDTPKPPYVFGVNSTAHAAWVIGTALGFVASTALGDLTPFGFDYALPAMFIALLVIQMHGELTWWAAAFAGSTALLLHVMGYPTAAIMIGTLVGSTAGMMNDLCVNRSSS